MKLDGGSGVGVGFGLMKTGPLPGSVMTKSELPPRQAYQRLRRATGALLTMRPLALALLIRSAAVARMTIRQRL